MKRWGKLLGKTKAISTTNKISRNFMTLITIKTDHSDSNLSLTYYIHGWGWKMALKDSKLLLLHSSMLWGMFSYSFWINNLLRKRRQTESCWMNLKIFQQNNRKEKFQFKSNGSTSMWYKQNLKGDNRSHLGVVKLERTLRGVDAVHLYWVDWMLEINRRSLSWAEHKPNHSTETWIDV